MLVKRPCSVSGVLSNLGGDPVLPGQRGSRAMTSSRTSRMWIKAAVASESAVRWAVRAGSDSMRRTCSAIRWVRAIVAKSPVVSR